MHGRTRARVHWVWCLQYIWITRVWSLALCVITLDPPGVIPEHRTKSKFWAHLVGVAHKAIDTETNQELYQIIIDQINFRLKLSWQRVSCIAFLQLVLRIFLFFSFSSWNLRLINSSLTKEEVDWGHWWWQGCTGEGGFSFYDWYQNTNMFITMVLK